MFNVGPDKLIVLFVVALIVLGPKKLPDAARNLGRALAEFRRISGSLQSEVREALSDPKDALTAAVADVRQELDGMRGGLGLSGGAGVSGGVGVSAEPPTWTAPVTPAPVPVPPSPDDPSLN